MVNAKVPWKRKTKNLRKKKSTMPVTPPSRQSHNVFHFIQNRPLRVSRAGHGWATGARLDHRTIIRSLLKQTRSRHFEPVFTMSSANNKNIVLLEDKICLDNFRDCRTW